MRTTRGEGSNVLCRDCRLDSDSQEIDVEDGGTKEPDVSHGAVRKEEPVPEQQGCEAEDYQRVKN